MNRQETIDQVANILSTKTTGAFEEASKSNLKYKNATVVGYDEETYLATVYFDNKSDILFTFYNKTGSILSGGDNVKIQYTVNPAKGDLVVKCGLPMLPKTENNDENMPFTSFVANADGSYTYNDDVTYSFSTDENNKINSIADSNGNSVIIDTTNATVNDSVVNFNTLVMAGAIFHGIKSSGSNTTVFDIEITADGGVITVGYGDTSENYTGTIDWGDGNSEDYSTRQEYVHTYATAGNYSIKLTSAVLTSIWNNMTAASNSTLKAISSMSDSITRVGCGNYNDTFESIKLGKNVTVLQDSNFNGMTTLKAFYGFEQITSMGYTVFANCDLSETPDINLLKCTSIGGNSFFHTKIISINAPLVTDLSSSPVFIDCTMLKTVNLPMVTAVATNEFLNASGITTAHFESLANIPSSVFDNKTDMTLYVTDALQYIGYNAFYNSVVVIEYRGTQEQWESIEKDEYWNYNATITLHCNG